MKAKVKLKLFTAFRDESPCDLCALHCGDIDCDGIDCGGDSTYFKITKLKEIKHDKRVQVPIQMAK